MHSPFPFPVRALGQEEAVANRFPTSLTTQTSIIKTPKRIENNNKSINRILFEVTKCAPKWKLQTRIRVTVLISSPLPCVRSSTVTVFIFGNLIKRYFSEIWLIWLLLLYNSTVLIYIITIGNKQPTRRTAWFMHSFSSSSAFLSLVFPFFATPRTLPSVSLIFWLWRRPGV